MHALALMVDLGEIDIWYLILGSVIAILVALLLLRK